MKAAVVNAVGEDFVIEDVEIADPIGREVLVDVKASGLCHSDSHIQKIDFGFPMPVVLGHEIAGVVKAVGPDVVDLKVGDRVAASLVGACGVCDSCIAGKRHICENTDSLLRGADEPSRLTRKDGSAVTQFQGISGFAEQCLVHENQLVKISDAVPFDKACLLGCGVVTGAGAVLKTAGVRVNEDVAVIGCGGVGLNAVQAARLAGARRIIAIDLQPAKLELAKKFGATHVINPNEVEDVVAAVHEITGRKGVDHAFEVIGLKPTAEQAFQIVGPDGTAYLIGMQRPGTRLDIDPITQMIMTPRTLHGVYMGSTNAKLDIPMFADYYEQGRFNLDDLVSRTITLDEINEGYAELDKGGVARCVIVFD